MDECLSREVGQDLSSVTRAGAAQLHSDLVEEKGPVVGSLEPPVPAAQGTHKGPLLVSEGLGLDQRLGDRAAVHNHEGPVPARALVVDRARHPA